MTKEQRKGHGRQDGQDDGDRHDAEADIGVHGPSPRQSLGWFAIGLSRSQRAQGKVIVREHEGKCPSRSGRGDGNHDSDQGLHPRAPIDQRRPDARERNGCYFFSSFHLAADACSACRGVSCPSRALFISF